MAESSTGGDTGWARWLRDQLRERDWQPIEVTRRSDGKVASSQMTRWLDSSRTPDIESIRKVCAILGVPAVAGMIAAGRLRPEDVGATIVQRTNLRGLSKTELLAYYRALGEELAARIPDDAEVELPTGATPFRRVNPLRIDPDDVDGQTWAALDRRKD